MNGGIDLEELATNYSCAYCGADAGGWCIARPSGVAATYIHKARVQPIYEAYWAGLREEENNLFDAYFNRHDSFVWFAERWANRKESNA